MFGGDLSIYKIQKKRQESKIVGKFSAVRMGEAFAIGKHTC